FNAFGIIWVGSKTFAFFFKLSEEEADPEIIMTKYEYFIVLLHALYTLGLGIAVLETAKALNEQSINISFI
ncbi:MAG: hypothetical protein ACHQX1_03115, partial [Candidatus Micrarchaeales archaeon]